MTYQKSNVGAQLRFAGFRALSSNTLICGASLQRLPDSGSGS